MYSNTSIVKILWRYKKHEKLTEGELAELREWLGASALHEDLFDDLSNTQKWDHEIADRFARNSNATWEKIRERMEEIAAQENGGRRKIGWKKYSVAAAALVILLSGVWHFLKIKNQEAIKNIPVARFKNEIFPITGTAVLTLSDGSSILLDSAKNGELVKQGSVSIIKTDSGQLHYKAGGNITGETGYNTLTIPRGGQYHLILPDGSKVWLNAASSLRYPVAFTEKDRTVELSGEAYFEITKNKEKPFLVKESGSVIRVLGTHFNSNAYPDEPVSRTTVLEGSVSVKSGKDSVVLKPDEEAEQNKSGQMSVLQINPEQSIAWKDKLFWFRHASFEQIMRQFSRWYDIDVKYEGKPNQTFTGILPCNLPLTNLLHVLEKGGNVQFTIDGKKLTVKS